MKSLARSNIDYTNIVVKCTHYNYNKYLTLL